MNIDLSPTELTFVAAALNARLADIDDRLRRSREAALVLGLSSATESENAVLAVRQLYATLVRRVEQRLDTPTATEADAVEMIVSAPQCRFCRRTDLIADGLYTRVQFPDGIALVCDPCRERANESADERQEMLADRELMADEYHGWPA